MYLPAIVMVGYYFDKRRALATGIAVCGSGIGSFVFSPLNDFLLSVFDWKGAMWIISALSLHGIVFASLFRPLIYDDSSSSSSSKVPSDEETLESGKAESHVPLVSSNKDNLKRDLLRVPENGIYRCRSLEHCNGSKSAEIARLGHSLFLDSEPHSRKHTKGRHVLNPLERKDIFYSGSIQNLPEYKKAGDEEHFVWRMLSLNKETDSTDTEDTADSACRKIFNEMFDFSLLRSITFDIYCISCLLCMIGKFCCVPPLVDNVVW